MLRFIFLGFVVFVLACGTSNAGTQIGTSAPSAKATAAPAKTKIYKVGDLIEVEEQTIVMNSADIVENVLKANFTLTNKGTDDENVSSLLSFSAKDSEGVKLDASIFDCGSTLNGKVLPGEKLRGDICWKTTNDKPFRIYYEANVFGSGAIVWEIE